MSGERAPSYIQAACFGLLEGAAVEAGATVSEAGVRDPAMYKANGQDSPASMYQKGLIHGDQGSNPWAHLRYASNTKWGCTNGPPPDAPDVNWVAKCAQGFERKLPDCHGCQNNFVSAAQPSPGCECPTAPTELDQLFHALVGAGLARIVAVHHRFFYLYFGSCP